MLLDIFVFHPFGVALGLARSKFDDIFLDRSAGGFDVHHNTRGSRGHDKGAVLHVSGFLPKDGTQEALFRCQLRLALWGDFPD